MAAAPSSDRRSIGGLSPFIPVAAHVLEQDRPDELELSTNGYTRLSFYGDYHWQVSNTGQFKVFVQGSNLMDEEIRNHASLLRNFAPEAGRNIRVGLRYSY